MALHFFYPIGVSKGKQTMEATNFNFIGALEGGMETAPTYLVAQCRTWKQAVELCMALSSVKRSRSAWAELLGVTPGTLSMILNKSGERRRKLDADELNLIQKAARNRAISQWMDMDLAGELNHQNAKLKRINELEAELESLKGLG